MKVYLVSEVKCYSDQPMIKRFETFSTEEDAIEYKNWLKEKSFLLMINIIMINIKQVQNLKMKNNQKIQK